MAPPIILALAFKRRQGKAPAVLSLTDDYEFTVDGSNHKSSSTTAIKVRKIPHIHSRTSDLPVDSITVVYGENGEGKTALLLDACQSVVKKFYDQRQLSIIWRDESGVIHLDDEGVRKAFRLEGPETSQKKKQFSHKFGAIFYTTSPFESNRRLRLQSSGTIDSTPKSGTASYSGAALCLAAGSLPKNIPFIRRAKIGIDIETSVDIQTEIESVSTFLSSNHPKGRRSSKFSSLGMALDRLRKDAFELSPRSRTLLAIELRRARLDGAKALDMLLYELSDRKEKPMADNRSISRFLRYHASAYEKRPTANQILSILIKLRRSISATAPKGLSEYARTLRSVSPNISPILQEAERLGLINWKFIELSSGQVALLLLFASLSSALNNFADRNIRSALIAIDEGEMFMHPSWQRQYLRDILNFISRYRRDFDHIHLILATHSLIVAGDTPPNRLFDVKSGSMQNGFALGPKELLDRVYGVKDFSGSMAENLYKIITNFLSQPRSNDSAEAEIEIRSLIDQIASRELREYLLTELHMRTAR